MTLECGLSPGAWAVRLGAIVRAVQRAAPLSYYGGDMLSAGRCGDLPFAGKRATAATGIVRV